MVVLDENKVWIDGCFDFTHHGHAGAILQARRTADRSTGQLICGVHSDKEIARNKDADPVMNERERYEHTRSSRWCDMVIEDAPYVTQSSVLDAYGCMYVVHGDDITLDAEGNDCYQLMKDIGRFKTVKRTPDVSTSDIINRILTGTHSDANAVIKPTKEELLLYSSGCDGYTPYCYVYENSFDCMIIKGEYEWPKEACYVKGDFDLFHMGHISKLRSLQKKFAKKVVVGITTTSQKDGCIMSLKERVLSVMGSKYVDAVIMVTENTDVLSEHDFLDIEEVIAEDGFQYLTKQVIIDRILSNRALYVARNKKKGYPQ